MPGVEIERKWIVDEVPEDALASGSQRVDQGYLTVGAGDAETRVRRRADTCTLTVKSGSGRTRAEHEIELTQAQFDALWPATEGARVRKRRHVIALGDGHRIELDVYEGTLAGLVVAEVEFEDAAAAEAFVAPGWFGREVTDDGDYRNQRLALAGRPAGLS